MSLFLLIIAFVCSGLTALSNKMLIEWGLSSHMDIYLLGFYITPALLGIIVIGIKKEKGTGSDYRLGILMGIAGVLGIIVFLIALTGIPGIVAFPISSLGNLMLTALVSMVAWKERLSRSQWLGMILSFIAIWLLS